MTHPPPLKSPDPADCACPAPTAPSADTASRAGVGCPRSVSSSPRASSVRGRRATAALVHPCASVRHPRPVPWNISSRRKFRLSLPRLRLESYPTRLASLPSVPVFPSVPSLPLRALASPRSKSRASGVLLFLPVPSCRSRVSLPPLLGGLNSFAFPLPPTSETLYTSYFSPSPQSCRLASGRSRHLPVPPLPRHPGPPLPRPGPRFPNKGELPIPTFRIF